MPTRRTSSRCTAPQASLTSRSGWIRGRRPGGRPGQRCPGLASGGLRRGLCGLVGRGRSRPRTAEDRRRGQRRHRRAGASRLDRAGAASRGSLPPLTKHELGRRMRVSPPRPAFELGDDAAGAAAHRELRLIDHRSGTQRPELLSLLQEHRYADALRVVHDCGSDLGSIRGGHPGWDTRLCVRFARATVSDGR